MTVIWKEPLPLEQGLDTLTVESCGALSVGFDANGVPCVWFWAPEENSVVERVTITLLGTGIEAPQRGFLGRYLGTFVWRTSVLHAFEMQHLKPEEGLEESLAAGEVTAE